MKIKYLDWRDKYGAKRKNIQSLSISDFVAANLVNSDRDGEIERLRDDMNKTADGVGRLVEVLAKKNLLTAGDVAFIAGGSDEVIGFENEK